MCISIICVLPVSRWLPVKKNKLRIIVAVKMPNPCFSFLSFFFLSLLRSWSISLNIHVARYYWHFSPALIAVGICCQLQWEEGGSNVVAYLCQTADRISSNQIHLEMLIKNYANNWYKNKWKVLKNNFHIWFSDK